MKIADGDGWRRIVGRLGLVLRAAVTAYKQPAIYRLKGVLEGGDGGALF